MKRITLIAGLATAVTLAVGTLSAQADPYHRGDAGMYQNRGAFETNHYRPYGGGYFHRPHFRPHWPMWHPRRHFWR